MNLSGFSAARSGVPFVFRIRNPSSLAYLSLGPSNDSRLQVIYHSMDHLHKRLGVKSRFPLWAWMIVLSCSLWHAPDLPAQTPTQTPASPQAHAQTLEG